MSSRQSRKTKVVITRNFEANLNRIERFLRLEDVAVDFELTRERVLQIERRALAQIRQPSSRAGALPLVERSAPLFDRLIDDLLERVAPLLERTPRLGTPFVTTTLSTEGRFVFERIQTHLEGREIRQLVRPDFVVLYLVSPREVALVAVRHHREQGFRLTR